MKDKKKYIWLMSIIAFIILLMFLLKFVINSITLMYNYLLPTRAYTQLITDDINTIPDDKLIDAVMGWMWNKVGSDWSKEELIISTLPKACQDIYSVYTIEAEVNNGGFNQCYYNSSRKLTGMAQRGFEAIGANGFASIMKQTNQMYVKIKDDLDKIEDGSVEGYILFNEMSSLNQFDDLFMGMYEDENLQALCVAYIRENVEFFGE